MNAIKPQSDKKVSEIANFLKEKMDNHPSSLKEIAKKIGYEKSNILSMMKAGDAKVPLDKVIAIAEVLSIDPINLMKLALKQSFSEESDIWQVFDKIPTYNEMKIINAIRREYIGGVPLFDDKEVAQTVNYMKKIHLSRK